MSELIPITAYVGPMKSGKSTELVNDYLELLEQGVPEDDIYVFKINADALDSTIKPRDYGNDFELPAEVVEEVITDALYVFGDELHFADDDEKADLLLSQLLAARERGADVRITTLDRTFTGELWPFSRKLFALPEDVVRIEMVTAWCDNCDRDAAIESKVSATHSVRLNNGVRELDGPTVSVRSDDRVESGQISDNTPSNGEEYEAWCQPCFEDV